MRSLISTEIKYRQKQENLNWEEIKITGGRKCFNSFC